MAQSVKRFWLQVLEIVCFLVFVRSQVHAHLDYKSKCNHVEDSAISLPLEKNDDGDETSLCSLIYLRSFWSSPKYKYGNEVDVRLAETTTFY
jgi:hypothetical protein